MFRRLRDLGRDTTVVAATEVQSPPESPPQVAWVACDFETTGLHPAYHHRVVEAAFVTGVGDRIEREWTSLICPDRDIGAGDIHGLYGRDLINAPHFEQLLGSMLGDLHGRVIVAHNARFDEAFLEAELVRAGVELPPLPWLCTLQLTRRLGAVGGRLQDCSCQFGVQANDAHTALGDARAVAGLVIRCWDRIELEPVTAQVPWPTATDTAAACPRSSRPPQRESYLRRLAMSRPSVNGGHAELAAYMELLDRVLEDRRVTDQEAGELSACADLLGLSAEEAGRAHRQYLASLLAVAQADAVVTERERRDLECVAELLGEELDGTDLPEPSSPTPSQTGSMRGLTVCFTGALECRLGGEKITRERAQELATNAGLVVHSRVTKSLDVLVCADPESMSGKAKTAREYGTRVLAETAFWPLIDVDVQ
jgi:DNA polymerase III subunit epsilon